MRDDVSHVVRMRNRPITVIGARAGERDVPMVWLDPEYGVIRVVTREKLPTGPALVDQTFSEHRALVGGFLFPYRREAFVDGKLLLRITVRSVRPNTNLPDSLFDPRSIKNAQMPGAAAVASDYMGAPTWPPSPRRSAAARQSRAAPR